MADHNYALLNESISSNAYDSDKDPEYVPSHINNPSTSSNFLGGT